MTPEQAAAIQPGDVVYYRETRQHYVVGRVFAHAIAAPLFHLEAIGREDTRDDPGRVSWILCEPPQEGHPRRAPYRGGPRYSVRTLRAQGVPLHPIPGEESHPDEALLLTTAQAAAELSVSPQLVRRLIAQKRLPARKLGRDHVIVAVDLERVRERGKAGRPARGES